MIIDALFKAYKCFCIHLSLPNLNKKFLVVYKAGKVVIRQ